MLLNAKKLAFLGLLLAVTVIMIILSGVFEFNTMFLLAAASFGVGIAIRESGLRIGTGFYLAAILLGVMLAPNKLYCITFAAMGFYIVFTEFVFDRLTKLKCSSGRKDRDRSRLFWVMKYIVFNVMYLPMIIFLPKLIYQGKMNGIIIAVLILGGEVAIYLFDMAYRYFQGVIWGKIRNKLQF